MLYNIKRGFTLLELLVVVLIIGILAAVAVPQYQKAVVRTELSTIKPILRSIVKAEEVFYLETGKYTYNTADLDIELPTNCTATTIRYSFPCGKYFSISSFQRDIDRAYFIQATWKDGDFVYRIFFAHSRDGATTACYGYTDFGRKFCKQINAEE